jgi:hypothetical protein
MKKNQAALLGPLIVLFVLVLAICGLFGDSLKAKQIDPWVVASANILLFLICGYSIYSQSKSVQHQNPHAMVRGVMGSVVLKLFVLGTAAFVYLYNAGESAGINGIFVSMGLYILYTWLEVKIAMKINPGKLKNGSN